MTFPGWRMRVDQPLKPLPNQDSAGSELRAAPRFSLMLRAGKLVSEAGEFLCILRDVSQTGFRARLFHALPAVGQYHLELGNGERFAVEPVWEEGDHAGFRFTDEPVNVQALVEETSRHPRRQLRLRVQPPLPVMIVADGVSRPARLLNLSQNGVAIEIEESLALRQPVQLEASGMSRSHGRVLWRRGKLHGIVLQEGFRMDELARLVVRLQSGASKSAGVQARESAAAVNL